MSAMNTVNSSQLIRTSVWADFLKERLEDQLIANKFATRMDFLDGTTLNIPSIGQLVAQDYQEGRQVTFQSPDLGNFQFTIDTYKDTSFAITDKAKRDIHYYQQLLADLPINMQRSLEMEVEKAILGLSSAQTAGNPNNYNGFAHRFVATGTNQTLTTNDIRYARVALIKAAISPTNLIGIIDPACENQLRADATLSNSITYQPQYADVISTGLTGSTGLQFKFNVEGFDIYTSNYLAIPGAETINAGAGGRTTNADSVANMFFSADPMHKVLLFGVRKQPNVVFWRDEEVKSDKYSVDMEWGRALHRPEGLVTILASVNTTKSI